MTTGAILGFAVAVFALMLVGIFLTMLEFNRLSDDPSRKRDSDIK